jgi:hypothetical protein
VENPSVRRQIKNLAEQQLDRDLILDPRRFKEAPAEGRHHPSTTIITESLELLETFEKAGRKLIVLVSPGPSANIFRLGFSLRLCSPFRWWKRLNDWARPKSSG